MLLCQTSYNAAPAMRPRAQLRAYLPEPKEGFRFRGFGLRVWVWGWGLGLRVWVEGLGV